MEEQIHGLTLQTCAEIMARDGELKAQYGERDYKPHLQQFLASQGIDENTWAHSWNGWWTRLESDPSGQLHAKFATMQQKLTMQAHMADVPDASATAKEGVTLDLYAQLMAKASDTEAFNALLESSGIDMAQWQRAQTAWNAAMAADTNHHLTTQYGTLYAKYTPGFEQQMEAQTAAIMAEDYAERAAGRPDEPEVEYTFADMLREMNDATPDTRWSAAHHVANEWDVSDNRAEPALDAAARKAVSLLSECLSQHNEFTVSNAESAASDMKMFASEGFLSPEQAGDALGDIQRCLGRGQEALATHKAAFAPIANKAVPERVQMQSRIQDFTSLVEELSDIVSEWNDNYRAPEAGGSDVSGDVSGHASASVPGLPSTNSVVPRIVPAGGFMGTLRRLPIIGGILRALGL